LKSGPDSNFGREGQFQDTTNEAGCKQLIKDGLWSYRVGTSLSVLISQYSELGFAGRDARGPAQHSFLSTQLFVLSSQSLTPSQSFPSTDV